MSHPRWLVRAMSLVATCALLPSPEAAHAGGGGGARGGGGRYHGGGYGYHGGGYGYRGGYYPYHHYGYGYGYGFGVGIYLGYPSGYPSDSYGPYAGYAPEYFPPPPAAPAPLHYAGPPGLPLAPGSRAGDLAPGDQQQQPADLTAHVEVRVPADADVWLGAGKTRQTGAVRQFVSPPLAPGQEYTYEVRARWTEGGKEVVQTRRLDVRAGSWKGVDFTRPAPEVVEPPKPARP